MRINLCRPSLVCTESYWLPRTCYDCLIPVLATPEMVKAHREGRGRIRCIPCGAEASKLDTDGCFFSSPSFPMTPEHRKKLIETKE